MVVFDLISVGRSVELGVGVFLLALWVPAGDPRRSSSATIALKDPLSGEVKGPGRRETECLLSNLGDGAIELGSKRRRSGLGVSPAGPEGVLMSGVLGRNEDAFGVVGTTGSEVVACIAGFLGGSRWAFGFS